MEEPERKKLAAAVMLGRRGGKTKTEAKAAAARLNGLLGGAQAWKKPREEWKPRKKKAIKAKKPKLRKVVIPRPMVDTAHVVLRPRITQKLVMERPPR